MLLVKVKLPRRIPMRKNREEKMLQCLDALEEVNEGLRGSLRECVNIIDRFLPLGDHETIWLDAYHDIRRLIATSEDIYKKRHKLGF
jgi:hypothetical protein